MKPEEMRYTAPKPASRQPQPGELLFELLVGHDRYLCELRDHGGEYGVEAQLFRNGQLYCARTFATWMGLTLPARDHAAQWARMERQAIEKGGE